MTQEDKARDKALPPGVSRIDEIDKRAEALRENLKKRKMQTGTKLSPKKQDETNSG